MRKSSKNPGQRGRSRQMSLNSFSSNGQRTGVKSIHGSPCNSVWGTFLRFCCGGQSCIFGRCARRSPPPSGLTSRRSGQRPRPTCSLTAYRKRKRGSCDHSAVYSVVSCVPRSCGVIVFFIYWKVVSRGRRSSWFSPIRQVQQPWHSSL